MSTHQQLAVAAGAALLLALAALVLAVLAWRTARTAGQAVRILAARRAADRRQRDTGPPDGIADRRRHRVPDDAGIPTRARRRDADDPQYRTDVRDQPDEEHPPYPPRPTPRHAAEESELDPAPPTADMRTLPPPGSIGTQ